MNDDIIIEETTVPLVGTATLIELSASDGYDHVTLSYDPPLDGMAFDTLDIGNDGDATAREALEAASMFARLDGYELVVPDDFYLSI